MDAVKAKPEYYKYGNNLMKKEGVAIFYLDEDGDWATSGCITVKFLHSDLSIDPIPITAEEAAKLFKRLGGRGHF